MMDKQVLQALSSDLKRVCLSIQKGSNTTAETFSNEAMGWLNEAEKTIKNPNTQDLIKKAKVTLTEKNDLAKAEECLMYSVLFQNRSFSLK